ncbi:MAG: SHOCT domain-containing protein [Myxococcales bacterium]|nr:SHOCT domain-containing protein [Myxococcales bacterium]
MTDAAKTATREAQADALIRQHVLWATGAGALPVPVLDFTAVTGIQLDLLKKLALVYGVAFDRARGQAWLSALSAGMTARLGANLLKLLPGIGQALGGASLAASSGASTYALGQVARRHFAANGDMASLDLEAAKAEFAAASAEGAAPADDVVARLERLAALRADGTLTDEEFATLKARILETP